MSTSIALADFDVAMQPGLRQQLAAVYQEFRSAQSASQGALSEPDLISARHCCPACDAPTGAARILFHKNDVAHARCQRCDLVYTQVTLSTAADAAQYDDNAFMRAYVTLKRHPLYAQLETTKAAYLLQQAQAFSPGLRTVLDIGASTGAVMAAAAAQGLIAYGIEPDGAMAELLGTLHPQRFVKGYFPMDLPDGWPRFDLITLLDVLEHMVDPLAFLQSVHGALGAQGLLLIQVPNFHSLLVQLEGQQNTNFCIGHWQHFSAPTLSALLTRAGFRTLTIGNCISEFDRIQAWPQEQIDATVARLLGRALPVKTPEELYQHGLGYKLYGLFASTPD